MKITKCPMQFAVFPVFLWTLTGISYSLGAKAGMLCQGGMATMFTFILLGLIFRNTFRLFYTLGIVVPTAVVILMTGCTTPKRVSKPEEIGQGGVVVKTELKTRTWMGHPPGR